MTNRLWKFAMKASSFEYGLLLRERISVDMYRASCRSFPCVSPVAARGLSLHF